MRSLIDGCGLDGQEKPLVVVATQMIDRIAGHRFERGHGGKVRIRPAFHHLRLCDRADHLVYSIEPAAFDGFGGSTVGTLPFDGHGVLGE